MPREFEQGTNQNVLNTEHMDKIVETFQKREVIEKYSYSATFGEIEENDFNLNIPRYVDTFEPEPEVDIPAVQEKIQGLENKLAGVRTKMDGYLEELGF